MANLIDFDPQRATTGGSLTASIPATPTGNVVIKGAPGRLCRVLVTTAGTGSGNVLFYDNATTNSGTVVGAIPATVSVTGTPYMLDMPCANGIVAVQVSSGPVLTVSYF
jgi:hypothetical protein